MGKKRTKTVTQLSWLWYVCSPLYVLIDKFFWYFWRPFWGFILFIPSLIEEQVLWGAINFVKRKIRPQDKPWWGTELFYRLFLKLMFQCPNCRSSHLDELWDQ